MYKSIPLYHSKNLGLQKYALCFLILLKPMAVLSKRMKLKWFLKAPKSMFGANIITFFYPKKVYLLSLKTKKQAVQLEPKSCPRTK